MDEPKFFAKESSKESQPKKSHEVPEVIGNGKKTSNRFPIYWPLILEILIEYKDYEKKFKEEPKWFKSQNFDSKDLKDFKNSGMLLSRLTTALSDRVSNTELKPRDFIDLLEMMTDHNSPYLYLYVDDDGKERYSITLLGESALEKIENDKVMTGYWSLVRKASTPSIHKRRLIDLMRRR